MSSVSKRGASRLRSTLLVCALIVVSGAAGLVMIFGTEPGAERETAVRQSAVPVDLAAPESGIFQPVIHALGSVRPEREIDLRSRVGGQVMSISDRLVPGGFVREGDVLMRIDDANYRNVLMQRESELQQSIAELELEKGQQIQAEREYQDLKQQRGEALDPANLALILRQPQLQSAEARVTAARAAEAQARLDLERTVIRAPFDAQVLDRAVDLGSQVSTGETLAHLVGLEQYWVEATVPLDQLRWLEFSNGEQGHGSTVLVRHRSAWPEGQVRQGVLDQLVGSLEGGTRLARVLVVVDDPLALEPENQGRAALIIGAFVETQIEGREINGALKLSRDVIRQDDTVWLMREGALVIQPVTIEFEDRDFAYIASGIEPDDRIVTTNLATVKEGLRLRDRNAGGETGDTVATQQ